MHRTDLNSDTIAQALALEYDAPMQVTPVANAAFKDEVADATLKFHTRTPDGTAGFLLVSGAGNPQMIARALRNIETARARLPEKTAAVILPPQRAGEILGRSFAIWPAHHPFEIPNRLRRRLRYRLYTGRIAQWIEEVSVRTLTPAAPEDALTDLARVADDSDFAPDLRTTAEQAADRIRAGVWAPMHCLQHGDFWPENLLLPATPGGPAFYVIDWGGMAAQGYPFLDLLRMLMSLRASRRTARHSLQRLCTQIGCTRQDAAAYLLCATGQIGRNLEHFPPEAYRGMAETLFRYQAAL